MDYGKKVSGNRRSRSSRSSSGSSSVHSRRIFYQPDYRPRSRSASSRRSSRRDRSNSYHRRQKSRTSPQQFELSNKRSYAAQDEKSMERTSTPRRISYKSRRSRSTSSRRSYRRSRSHSPMSSRKRHIGLRERPHQSCCLGIFGLSEITNEATLKEIFQKYGRVENVQVVNHRDTGKSRGFAFLNFKSVEEATVARNACNGMEVDGKNIRVSFSITERAHTPTPGIYVGSLRDEKRRSRYERDYRDSRSYRERRSSSRHRSRRSHSSRSRRSRSRTSHRYR